MIKKILVTGDRGYIGSSLVQVLLEQGMDVIGYDVGFFSPSLQTTTKKKSYKQITKDIRKVEKKDVEGIDGIIHLSALSNDPMGNIDPKLTQDINSVASLRLAELAKAAGVQRFLFSSSCSVYGKSEKGIVDEKSIPAPLTAYAKSKLAVENELQKIKDKNFCVGLLRNPTVYGYSSNFRSDLVVNNLVCVAIAYKKIKVLSDGTPWRPLIDVRDLARIFYEFLLAKTEIINGKVLNIGFNENNFQVRDIVAAVYKEFPECEIVYTGEHGSDTRSYRVNFDRFQKLFSHVKQQWPLGKSIRHLGTHLKKIRFSKNDFEKGNFVRVNALKNLLSEKKLNTELFWTITP